MSNVITLSQAGNVESIETANAPAIVMPEDAPDLFHVEKLPISSQYGPIEGKRGLFVGQKCINLVSDRYEVHQPKEIYSQFERAMESSGLAVNRVLANPLNGSLLLSAGFGRQSILGEDHDVNLTFFTSHDGKYKTFLTLDLLRIACFNQIPALYANKGRHIFAEKHYSKALDLDLVGEIVAGIPAAIEANAERLAALKDKQFSFEDFAAFYAEHYKMREDQKQYESKLAKMKSVYYNAPGQKSLEDGAYKAFQCVTYLNTHEGRNTALKDQNAYIKGGDDSLAVWEKLLAA